MKEIEEKIIGMTEKQAKELVKGTQYYIYLIEKDGRSYAITDDIDFNRVRITINNDIITHASLF